MNKDDKILSIGAGIISAMLVFSILASLSMVSSVSAQNMTGGNQTAAGGNMTAAGPAATGAPPSDNGDDADDEDEDGEAAAPADDEDEDGEEEEN